MANWYVSSVGYAAVAQWAASTAYSVGQIVRQLAAPTAGNERCFRCSTGGTSGGSEPAWTLTLNGTTNDGSVVWTECTGQEAYQSAGNWTAPAATLDLILSNGGRGSASGIDNVFVADNHSETWTSARTWNSLNYTVCVTVAGSALPPTAASVSTGAAVTTTGNTQVALSRTGYFYGVDFSIGTGASAASLVIGSTAASGSVTMENCSLALGTTAAASRISLGVTSVVMQLTLINTPISFGAAGQGISITTGGSAFTWLNTPNAVQGTSPSNLLIDNQPMRAALIGVDLSGLNGNIMQTSAGANTFVGDVLVSGCKLGASTVLATNLRTRARSERLAMIGSDDTGSNLVLNAVYGAMAANGGITSDVQIYRAGGAEAGSGNPYSWLISASSTANGAPTWQYHPITPPIFFWNTTVGGSRVVTVYGIGNKTALPTNAIVFLEVQYIGATVDPGLFVSSGGPGPLMPASPTAVTPAAQDWTGTASARADSTAYTAGQYFQVASNPGRLFFCTTSGTTAGSEPAGYATAVDGDTIADGTAAFRAGWRFSMALTVTPEQEGWMAVYVHYLDSQGTPTAVYIDPMAIVS